jgi:hypothetical protein
LAEHQPGISGGYKSTTGGINNKIDLSTSAEAWQLGGENLFRHTDARYWLPSMDKWYKAAYYNPSTGT